MHFPPDSCEHLKKRGCNEKLDVDRLIRRSYAIKLKVLPEKSSERLVLKERGQSELSRRVGDDIQKEDILENRSIQLQVCQHTVLDPTDFHLLNLREPL